MGRGSSKVGGSGGSGGTKTENLSARTLYSRASGSYTVDYEPYARGQISKTDAGQLYKAVKNGDVTARKELVNQLYNQTEESIRFSSERYSQNYIYYDNIERLTHSLLNKDYETAQALIDEIESDAIKRAGKKSKWYKYKNK